MPLVDAIHLQIHLTQKKPLSNIMINDRLKREKKTFIEFIGFAIFRKLVNVTVRQNTFWTQSILKYLFHVEMISSKCSHKNFMITDHIYWLKVSLQQTFKYYNFINTTQYRLSAHVGSPYSYIEFPT